MKRLIFAVIALSIFILGISVSYKYSQQYHQDSNNTATTGIFFKTTLNLYEYKNISNGNDLWGDFKRYSRSDRHTESITVYCNKFCKK